MKVTPTPLFARKLEVNIHNADFINKLEKVLNINTLDSWTWKNTYKLFSQEYEDEYLAYRFKIISEWITLNEAYTTYFVKNLEEFIFILGLNEYLTTQEVNYINHYKAVVFAKNRNIKNLIVDFNVLDKEEVWYHYNLDLFYQKINDRFIKLQSGGNIYLSNQRIVLAKGNEYHSIYIKDILDVRLSSNMIEIITNYAEFLILTSDVHTLYVSIERIGKLMKIRL